MASGTERCKHICTTYWIAGRFRRVGWKVRIAQRLGPRPGPDSADKSIDLHVGKHSPLALREGWHLSPAYSPGVYPPNGGIPADRQLDRLPQSHPTAPFATT